MLAKNLCRSHSRRPPQPSECRFGSSLFPSELGNLTSCLELSNVFEISKYSIAANSTGNGSGIIRFSSPGLCPYCAIICHVIYLPAPEQTTVWTMLDAASTLTVHTPPNRTAGRSLFMDLLLMKAMHAIRSVWPDCGILNSTVSHPPTVRENPACNFSEICQNRNASVRGR